MNVAARQSLIKHLKLFFLLFIVFNKLIGIDVRADTKLISELSKIANSAAFKKLEYQLLT